MTGQIDNVDGGSSEPPAAPTCWFRTSRSGKSARCEVREVSRSRLLVNDERESGNRIQRLAGEQRKQHATGGLGSVVLQSRCQVRQGITVSLQT